MVEGLVGEAKLIVTGQGAVLQTVGNAVIVGRVADDDHAAVVLRRGAEHRRTADVDVFDRILQSDAFLRDGRLEGIEVDGNEVNGVDVELLEGRHMFGILTKREKTGVDVRVKRLYTTVEAFGIARDVGDVHNGKTAFAQDASGTAGGDDLVTEIGEATGKFDAARLVSETEQCSFLHIGFSFISSK